MTRKLKRSVIKEELVALTGDMIKAVILNQFLYWTERVKDVDKYIVEERSRMIQNGMNEEDIKIDLQNGWIYKSADEISDETMIGLSKSNVLNHIKVLIEKGWLERRQNPKYKWDKTPQYRVNIRKIQKDLQDIGYALEGYALLKEIENSQEQKTDENNVDGSSQPGSSKIGHRDSGLEHANTDTEHRSSNTERRDSDSEHAGFESEHRDSQNETAIPKIITENTSEITTKNTIQNPVDDDEYAHTREQSSSSLFALWGKEVRLPDHVIQDIQRLLTEKNVDFSLELFEKVFKKTFPRYLQGKTGPFASYFVGALVQEQELLRTSVRPTLAESEEEEKIHNSRKTHNIHMSNKGVEVGLSSVEEIPLPTSNEDDPIQAFMAIKEQEEHELKLLEEMKTWSGEYRQRFFSLSEEERQKLLMMSAAERQRYLGELDFLM